jgi:hypothetical protein
MGDGGGEGETERTSVFVEQVYRSVLGRRVYKLFGVAEQLILPGWKSGKRLGTHLSVLFVVMFCRCVCLSKGCRDERRALKRRDYIGVAAEDPGVEGCVEIRRFGELRDGRIRPIVTPQGLRRDFGRSGHGWASIVGLQTVK